MTTKRKQGRPPQLPTGTRTRMVQVRLSEDELAILRATAGDYPVATWLRALGLAEARRVGKRKA